MFWIEGIGRDTEGFVAQTITLDQKRENMSLSVLCESLNLGRPRRVRFTTDCATWERANGKPFWSALGINTRKPEDRHGVFSFHHDGKSYLLPASVFIAAVMRPIQQICGFLFMPQGLDVLCLPLPGEDGPPLGAHVPLHAAWGSRALKRQGLLATYSWMHSFPSANAMWSSVYRAACQGRLDVELPEATMTVTLRSVRAGPLHLVNEMNLLSVAALEDPFPFAALHSRRIITHNSASLDWGKLHYPVSAIPSRGSDWRLSDEEWLALESLLGKRRQEKFSLRDIIDLILIKLGTAQPWRKLDFGILNFPIVQATYQSLTRSGRWSDIEATLCSFRVPEADSA